MGLYPIVPGWKHSGIVFLAADKSDKSDKWCSLIRKLFLSTKQKKCLGRAKIGTHWQLSYQVTKVSFYPTYWNWNAAWFTPHRRYCMSGCSASIQSPSDQSPLSYNETFLFWWQWSPPGWPHPHPQGLTEWFDEYENDLNDMGFTVNRSQPTQTPMGGFHEFSYWTVFKFIGVFKINFHLSRKTPTEGISFGGPGFIPLVQFHRLVQSIPRWTEAVLAKALFFKFNF